MSQEKNNNNLLFARELKKLMENDHITQEKLAKYLGIAQTAVSNYLRGFVPRSDILLNIARHFDVTVEQLMNGGCVPGSLSAQSVKLLKEDMGKNLEVMTGPTFPIENRKNVPGLVVPVKLTRRTVGIYGIAYCRTGKPQFYDAKQSDHCVPQIEVPPGLSRVKRLAAFRASDSSMSPLINEKDIIFFSPDYDLENGNVCVLKYDDTIVCKRFYKKDSVVSLSSDATGIAPIVLKPGEIDWAYRALTVISERKL